MSAIGRPSESLAEDDAADDDGTVELLELLGDEYTRRVLTAVTQQPRSGREVMEVADVSKATAYRRLGELEDAGLIESKTVFDPDGHHHEQFRTVVDAVDVQFTDTGVNVAVTSTEAVDGAEGDSPADADDVQAGDSDRLAHTD